MLELEERLRPLMLLSLSGDASAACALLTELSVHLRFYFFRRVGGDADVEDLVQDTLFAIHTKRETFDPSGLVTAWVFAIARHKLIDWYRRRDASRTVPLEDIGPALTEDDYEGATAHQDIERLLEELPYKQAAAVRCTKIEGLSVLETAQRTGQSIAAVKVNVYRGLKKLADRLRGAR